MPLQSREIVETFVCVCVCVCVCVGGGGGVGRGEGGAACTKFGDFVNLYVC